VLVALVLRISGLGSAESSPPNELVFTIGTATKAERASALRVVVPANCFR